MGPLPPGVAPAAGRTAQDVDLTRAIADEHPVPIAAFRARGAAGADRWRTAHRGHGDQCVPADPATVRRAAADRLADRAGGPAAHAGRVPTPLGRAPPGG